jgi:CRISPR-associated endoribonuclease Cas2 subtype I-E
VRDELWERSLKALIKGEGSVVQIWSSNNAQGFGFRQFGPNIRELVDFEGLALVKKNDSRSALAQNDDTTSQ